MSVCAICLKETCDINDQYHKQLLHRYGGTPVSSKLTAKEYN